MNTDLRTLGSAAVTVFVVVLVAVAVASTGAIGTVGAQNSLTVQADVPDVTVGTTESGQITLDDAAPVGAYKLVVTYDEADISLTASGTDRFDVNTSSSSGQLTIVGYTEQTSGTVTTLANLEVTGDANVSSTQVDIRIETLSDVDGNSLSATGATSSLTVLSDTASTTSTPSSGGSSGGGGGGGGGGGQSGGSAAAKVDSVATQAGVTINIREAGIGATFTADIPQGAASSSTASVTKIEVSMKFDDSSFRLEVTKPQQTPPGGAPSLDIGAPVSYFTASAINVPASDIGNSKLHFTVESSALPDGASPSDVALYRYHDGKWRKLNTKHVGGNQYVATTPGFSAFAIGVEQKQSQTTSTATLTATPTQTATPEPAETSTKTATATTTTKTIAPGFGLVLTLLSLIIGIVVLARRE